MQTMEHAQTYAMFRIIIGIKAPWKFSQSIMAAGESVVVGVRVRCDGLEDVGSTGCLFGPSGFFHQSPELDLT